ncbi:hypothetical protein [Deinococcus indicus]|uniref:hypothetical protein n=1 Tax=Deinococcus indicus TaxID=223556 RepID=UPI0011776830|nr:hypothetical protein [Deinococcus indicus]GHG26532.1 hypothetical protein GCM10017784_18830 [Deinococcus indicus]
MTESRPPAVELRIYPDFSEVRTLVQSEADRLELTFPATTWESVDPESITLICRTPARPCWPARAG